MGSRLDRQAQPKDHRRPTPPRLAVLLARKSPLALVLRRGPSRYVACILWDRTDDSFRLGQWLRGSIYPMRSDLSPDGKHWIYFAYNGKMRTQTRGAWTAVARAPYLKAVSLYGKGDAWHGGGLFESDRAFHLNDGYGHEVLREDPKIRRLPGELSPFGEYGGEDPGVYFVRLQRDGWTMTQLFHTSSRRPDRRRDALGLPPDVRAVFEKPAPRGWLLRLLFYAGGPRKQGVSVYYASYQLASKPGALLDFPDWTWAEWDGKRLLWATDGRLVTGRLTKDGLEKETCIRDFGDMRFEELQAPY